MLCPLVVRAVFFHTLTLSQLPCSGLIGDPVCHNPSACYPQVLPEPGPQMPVAQLGFVLVTRFCIWGNSHCKRVWHALVKAAGAVSQVSSSPAPHFPKCGCWLASLWSSLETQSGHLGLYSSNSHLNTNLQRLPCTCKAFVGAPSPPRQVTFVFGRTLVAMGGKDNEH